MIVASGDDADGRKVLVFGLSAENLRRLQLHQPIDVPRAGLVAAGVPQLRVFILFGETEQAIADELVHAKLLELQTPTGKMS